MRQSRSTRRAANGQAVATAEPAQQLAIATAELETPAGRWHRARKTALKGYPRRNAHLTKDQVAKAFRASHGNVLLTAERLGVTRQCIYQWVTRNEELKQLRIELQEEEIDHHEEALRWLAIDELHPTAVLAYLNAKGRTRGWGRTDVERIPMGETHYHLHLHSEKLRELDDDRLASMIEQRRAEIQHAEPGTVEIIPPSRTPPDRSENP